MRWVLLILGGLMVLMGGVWTLQGIGVLPGSFMTGETFWAVAGLLTLAGAAARVVPWFVLLGLGLANSGKLLGLAGPTAPPQRRKKLLFPPRS